MRVVMKRHGPAGYAVYLRLMEIMCGGHCEGMDLGDPLDVELIEEELHMTEGELIPIISTLAQKKYFALELWETQKFLLSHDLAGQYQSELRKKRSHGYRKNEAAVFKRDGHQCVYCGSKKDLSLDHIMPRSRGGSDDINNLACCCKSCNSSKCDRTPEEWCGISINIESQEP